METNRNTKNIYFMKDFTKFEKIINFGLTENNLFNKIRERKEKICEKKYKNVRFDF